MVDGLEPHDHILSGPRVSSVDHGPAVGREGVPGVWVVGGWVEGYTRYPPGTLPGPYLVIFWLKGPTHGQMKAILELFMRFLR